MTLRTSDDNKEILPLRAVRPENATPLRGFRKALYKILFNAVNDAIVLVDPQTGAFLEVNDKFCQMTGFNPLEAKNLTIKALFTGIAPHSAPQAAEYIRKTLEEGPQLFEWEAQDRFGRRHWVELNLTAIPIGRKQFLLGVVRDIQGRKEHEEQIRQSENAMLALLNALQDVALLLDLNGIIVGANNSAARRLRRSIPELIGKNIFELLPPDLAASRRAKFNELLQHPRIIQFEDENAGWHFLNILYPIFDAADRLVQVGVYAIDITENKKNRQELEKTRARLECLLEHTPAALYSCRFSNCCELSYISRNVLQLTGFSADAILADPFFWAQRIHPEDRRVISLKQAVSQETGQQRLEYRFLHQDGTYRWLHDEFNLVRDKKGQPLEFIGSLLDITAARQAQEKLALSEQRYRVMVECQTDLINRFTPDFTFIYVNEAICRFLGKSREELLGQSFLPLLEPEEQLTTREYFSRFTPQNPVHELEHSLLMPDGRHRWLAWIHYAFFDDQGQLREFQGVGRDITRRKEAEEALRESEQRFRTYVESSLVGVLVVQDYRLPYVNPAMARMFGYSPEDLISRVEVLDLVHPEDRPLVEQKISERLSGQSPERYTIRGLKKDGGIVNCELVGQFIEYQGRPAILATLIDVTQRYAAEQALRESEKQFRLLVETMNDGLGIGDKDKRIIYVNPRFCELIGYSEEELKGRFVAEFLDPPSQKVFASEFQKRAAGNHTPYELVWVHKDGSSFPSIVSPRPIFDSNGDLKGSFAIITDITARREAEAATQRREQYFRQLTENVSDVIGLLTAEGVISYLNPTGKCLLGYDPGELLGRNAFDLIHPDDCPALQRQFRRLLKHSQEVFTAVIRVRHSQNIWKIWQIKGKNLLQDPVVAGVVINAQDITEHKGLEAALKQSAKKLRSLTAQIFTTQETERRRLSLELHDELGQSLTALKLQLRSIANKLRRDQPQLKQECNQMLAYINEVVENVRRLSHDLSPSLLENVGLEAALNHLLEKFRSFYQISENLHELEGIDPILPSAGKIHLYRIFQEILTNIEKHSQATKVSIQVGRTPNRLTFTLADNGRGFPPDFSERAASPGGLGLPAIAERILMVGGTLEISSEEGQGVTIEVSVPLSKAKKGRTE